MRHTARIRMASGALILNTDTPYDYELACDHADRYATMQGAIEFDLEGVAWTVSVATDAAGSCAACGERLERLSYVRAHLVLCARCARTTRLVPVEPHNGHAPTRKPPRRKGGRALDRWRQRSLDGL